MPRAKRPVTTPEPASPQLPPEELRTLAAAGALAQIARLLAAFPELRGRVTLADGLIGPDEPSPQSHALRKAALSHWHKTRATSNGHSKVLRGLSIRDALRKTLSETPHTTNELHDLLIDNGYKHSGKSPIRSRISQEARELVKQGEAISQGEGRGKITWRAKGGE